VRWVIRVLTLVGLVSLATAGHCGATRCRQVTTNGRSVNGVFRPSGDGIAYVRYGQKHFDKRWGWGFDVKVCVQTGGRERELLVVPPRLEVAGRGGLPTRPVAVRWLPSGRYVVADNQGTPEFWLLAPDGSFRTKVGRYKSWFVLNEAVQLRHDDGVALNRMLRADTLDPHTVYPWRWDGTRPLTRADAPALYG
jgi:hypothetical protein